MRSDNKTCTKCKIEKQFDEFYPAKKGKFGLKAVCKQCESEYAKTPEQREMRRVRSAAIASTDERKNYMRDYALRSEVKEKKKVIIKNWQEKNKDRVYANRKAWLLANSDYKKEINARWKKENIAKCTANLAIYRARKLNATPGWANIAEINAIYAEAKKNGLHVDHIVPLRGKTVCGLHVENNLQLLTKHQNMSKGNKWPA